MTTDREGSPILPPVRTVETRFDSLTGMRAFAALAVAIHHAIAFWPEFYIFEIIGKWGYLGVDFFFCLSGFVMQWAWTRGTTARRFLSRRFARIYPLLVVTLFASLTAWWTIQNPLAGYAGPPRSVLFNLLAIQAWFFNDSTIRQSWNGVTWSLACEFFFYACSPFILSRFAKLKPKSCFFLIAALYLGQCIAQAAVVPGGSATVQNFFYFFPVARLPEFLMGALACQMFISGYRTKIRSPLVPFLLLVILPLAVYANVVSPADQFLSVSSLVVLPGFVVTIIVAASRDSSSRHSRRSRFLASRHMVWLGNVSYSYYVFHALVLGAIGFALIDWGFPPKTELMGTLWLVVFLLSSLLVAWLAWRLIERPAQRSIVALIGGPRRSRPVGIEMAASPPPTVET